MTTAPKFSGTETIPPDLEAIRAAHRRIAPHIHRTPVMTSASLDAVAGARLYFKCENLQKTGSFKIRGAANAIFSLGAEEAARGVVTHSSGNHAAAVALAARWRGIPAWVVIPSNAPAAKRRAVGGLRRPDYSLRTDARSTRGRRRRNHPRHRRSAHPSVR
jgi:threonine dehydratase